MSEEEQAKAGVRPDMIRVSVGLETLEDILWDIEQALEAAAKAKRQRKPSRFPCRTSAAARRRAPFPAARG